MPGCVQGSEPVLDKIPPSDKLLVLADNSTCQYASVCKMHTENYRTLLAMKLSGKLNFYRKNDCSVERTITCYVKTSNIALKVILLNRID